MHILIPHNSIYALYFGTIPSALQFLQAIEDVCDSSLKTHCKHVCQIPFVAFPSYFLFTNASVITCVVHFECTIIVEKSKLKPNMSADQKPDNETIFLKREFCCVFFFLFSFLPLKICRKCTHTRTSCSNFRSLFISVRSQDQRSIYSICVCRHNAQTHVAKTLQECE